MMFWLVFSHSFSQILRLLYIKYSFTQRKIETSLVFWDATNKLQGLLWQQPDSIICFGYLSNSSYCSFWNNCHLWSFVVLNNGCVRNSKGTFNLAKLIICQKGFTIVVFVPFVFFHLHRLSYELMRFGFMSCILILILELPLELQWSWSVCHP